jgi:hypothetical protein
MIPMLGSLCGGNYSEKFFIFQQLFHVADENFANEGERGVPDWSKMESTILTDRQCQAFQSSRLC